MKGAHKYHKMISKAVRMSIGNIKPYEDDKVKQEGTKYHYRNIVFVLCSHSVGLTFDIYITDSKGSFRVYGPISGTVGKSEKYGWIHKGNWSDFITNYLIEIGVKVREAEKARRERVKESKRTTLAEDVERFETAFSQHIKGNK